MLPRKSQKPNNQLACELAWNALVAAESSWMDRGGPGFHAPLVYDVMPLVNAMNAVSRFNSSSLNSESLKPASTSPVANWL